MTIIQKYNKTNRKSLIELFANKITIPAKR